MSELQQNGRQAGTIVEIKGVVIDAVFPNGLPSIYNALRIQVPARDGVESTTSRGMAGSESRHSAHDTRSRIERCHKSISAASSLAAGSSSTSRSYSWSCTSRTISGPGSPVTV